MCHSQVEMEGKGKQEKVQNGAGDAVEDYHSRDPNQWGKQGSKGSPLNSQETCAKEISCDGRVWEKSEVI